MSASPFPRTDVGGRSLPRLIIGTNWFRGYSHASRAKDLFIKQYQTPERIADVLRVYLDAGVDAVMGGDLAGGMAEAIERADVETYIQIYNAAGFLMQIEVDWVMRIIAEAARPVIAIKPMAGGRLMPIVGLAFVWSTIRERDLVCAGALTPDEARELIDISLDLLSRRTPDYELQATRSKTSLGGAGAAGRREGTAAGGASAVAGPGPGKTAKRGAQQA